MKTIQAHASSSMLGKSLLTGLVVALIGLAPGAGSAAPVELAPTADAYRLWLLATMDQIETNLPAVTAAAQIAADLFIAGRDLGVRGGAGLNEELGARAGGLCVYRATKGKPGDVVLYAFGVATDRDPLVEALLDKELTDAEALVAEGSTVIGLASFKQLAALGRLERAQNTCKILLDNFAPAGDGLFPDAEGRPTIPTFTTADALIGWVWTAEFFAACTRAGHTPAMYQSVVNDPERTRYAKYLKVRFHDDLQVAPIPAGQLGVAYLTDLRGLLAAVRQTQWPALAEAARRAAKTLRDGGQVYVFARGHYPPRHHGGQLPTDRSGFQRLMLPKPGATTQLPAPGAADYGLAVGYSLPPGDAFWSGADALLRQAGNGVGWIISGHRMQADSLRENEQLIDQCWPDGDASLKIPGYDVNICPPSGVMSEALMWMLTAEAWAQTTGARPAPLP